MGNLNVSNRYAAAFYQSAREKNVLEIVSGDMQLVYNTLAGSRELRNYLASPILKEAKKKEILNAVFGDRIGTDSIKFLNFIVVKKRVDILADIVKRFNDIRDEEIGIADAEITTAVETDSSQKDNLQKQLEEYTGTKLRMNFNVDNSIIGGFKAKVSDKVIDASVSNQLKKLKKKLLEESAFSN